MNKAFKVLWNDVRRSYVVSSEAQMSHGKPARSSKTLVVAAVAGVLALGASAAFATPLPQGPIKNDNLPSVTFPTLTGAVSLGTTKFVSGNGQEVVIQTEGNARQLLEAIRLKDLKKIREALGTGGGYATLVGTSGGGNFIDSQTRSLLVSGGLIKPTVGKLGAMFDELQEDVIAHSTSIKIGGNSTNPLVVGTVGSDRLINIAAALGNYDGQSASKISVKRQGNSTISMESGNSLLMVGAGSAINIGNAFSGTLEVKLPIIGGKPITPTGKETHVSLDGNSGILLSGSTSSFGTFTAGSAIAVGGLATSGVSGNSHLTIATTSKGQGFEGLTIGASGGGLAIGLFGGQAESLVEGLTTIDVNSGLSAGLLGGGIALGGQISKSEGDKILNKLPTSITDKINIKPNSEVFYLGGSASAKSQSIAINLGKNASSAFVVGGGLAAAYQYDSADQGVNAKAETGDVKITIGEKDVAPVFASVEEKGKYFTGIKNALTALKDVNADNIKDKEKDVVALIDTIASEPGVNVGVMGGGIAASWSRNEKYPNSENSADALTAPEALATVGDVVMDVYSGYNVGLIGGGLAAASGDATVPKDQTKPSATLAESTAKSVTMNFVGGETIGVMGGGIAVAAGTGDMNYGVGAVSDVGTVNLNVAGGSVDGLIGGGYAIDDTNPVENKQPQASKTASSTVDTVNITATSGQIGRLAFDAFFGQNQLPPLEKTQPGVRDYLDSMTYAMIEGKAAVIGGGMAAGLRDDKQEQGGAHVKNVNIVIAGDTVVGEKDNVGYRANIYGGGLATEGALSTVDKAYIQIGDASGQGPVINGDIYGGGIALDGMYMNAPYYNNAQSKVGSAEIVIANGTVNGDIYAGGRVISADSEKNEIKDEASSIVETAHVKLLKNGVFKGEKIDATGVTGDATLTMPTKPLTLVRLR